MDPAVALAAYLVFRTQSAWGYNTLVTEFPSFQMCQEALSNSKMVGPRDASNQTSSSFAFCTTDKGMKNWTLGASSK